MEKTPILNSSHQNFLLNKDEISQWCKINQPTRNPDVVVTGIEQSNLNQLLNFVGQLNSSLYVAIYAVVELRLRFWRETIRGEAELSIDETLIPDIQLSMHESITDGLLNRETTPFAWIHLGHGDYCEYEGASLSQGADSDDEFLATESIANTLAAMKGVCSLIVLPVCYSKQSAQILQSLDNVLYAHGTADKHVTSIDPQILELLALRSQI